MINGKTNMIESQNSKNFDLGSKKLMLLKFRTYAERGQFEEIENSINKSTLKKLGLTPLNIAEIYLEHNKYDKAVEYIKQITDNDYFDYKIDMLQYMEKYEVALEIIFNDKNKDTEKLKQYLDEIQTKRPDLKKKVEDLCLQYKINL
jgi:tetratricopeptide (TPR) repeat protein